MHIIKHSVEHLRNHKKTSDKIEKRTSNFSHVTVESTLLANVKTFSHKIALTVISYQFWSQIWENTTLPDIENDNLSRICEESNYHRWDLNTINGSELDIIIGRAWTLQFWDSPFRAFFSFLIFFLTGGRLTKADPEYGVSHFMNSCLPSTKNTLVFHHLTALSIFPIIQRRMTTEWLWTNTLLCRHLAGNSE
jgi:hypothetical protein